MNASRINAFCFAAALATLSACLQTKNPEQKGVAIQQVDTAATLPAMAKSKIGRTVSAHPSLDKAGLKITKVQDAPLSDDGKSHGLDVYILAESNARGKLSVLAYDMVGKELGRASVEMKRYADEGKSQRVILGEDVELGAIARLSLAFQPDARSAWR